MKRLSVIIANYNYARFLREAIDSALALRWPDVEVVVVDDGSTDDSAQVISAYGSRVTALFIENSGQREACNRGFSASSGDVVVFLDADDVLPPDLPARVAEVWYTGVSKVQVQMQRVTETGCPVGEPFPPFRPIPSPSQVRDWFVETSAYPTPPGSGNIYSRWFLEAIFPLGPQTGSYADSACLAAAPLLGDVVSLREVAVGYRQHQANDSFLLADRSRFAREVERARARWSFAWSTVSTDSLASAVDERPLFRSRELLQFRIAAARSGSGYLLQQDSRLRQFVDSVVSPGWPGSETLLVRVLILGWCLAMLVVPSWLADVLLRRRYAR